MRKTNNSGLMIIKDRLKILAEKIKQVYPKLDLNKKPADEKERNYKAILSDVQQRFAEIYAVCLTEIADDFWCLTYQETRERFPQKIESILNMISILALALKTKLILGVSIKAFDDKFISEMNAVCLECYTLKSILSEKPNSNAITAFNQGLTTQQEYSYEKTGVCKTIGPGLVKGQIFSFPKCSTEAQARHLGLINDMREKLDLTSKIPSSEERTILSVSSGNSNISLPEVRQPKTLAEMAAAVILKNRNLFFNDLHKLDEACRKKFPELETDYKKKFVAGVKFIILGISFDPSEKENDYLSKLANALEQENPYNATHQVLQDLDKSLKAGFYSNFKNHMLPVRNGIHVLMKKYNEDKLEYFQHYGKSPKSAGEI